MDIPTIPDLPAGHIVTADEMNQLGYACTFLATKPLTRARDATGGQALGTSATIINWTTTDVDSDSMWSSGNASRLTVQTPGLYKIRYAVAVAAASATRVGARCVSTTGSNNPSGSGVTSTPYWGAYVYCNASGTTQYAGASGVWPFHLYAGDYLQIEAYRDNAISTATTAPASGANGGSYFSCEFVSV
jgi:hypothetical protein